MARNSSGLTNLYIQDLLFNSLHLTNFKGVFSVDMINPRDLQQQVHWTVLINTDRSDKPGGHCIGLHKKQDDILYFDSLALPPAAFPDLHQLLMGLNTRIKVMVKQPIQDIWRSVYCGFYAMLFACMMDESMQAIVTSTRLLPFQVNGLLQNDEICIKNLETLFTKRIHYFCTHVGKIN